ncbi:YesL family protein [Paraliobacillus sediminis]|uniref:YesL family protein n=1 Tax=Paraliobacillus sediminis TaxID=1885916 RepID=UPI000E3E7E0C|nr:YesL family protein [Paraliobacillus sediminis]
MTKSLFTLTEWITRFAFLNLLWILFSLIGLLFFGLFPATVAMFTIIRKWLIGQSDLAIFPYFWKTYKREFLKSNLIGLIVVFVALIVYVDLFFMQTNSNLTLLLLHIPLYLFIFSCVLTLLYLFPVYVHYDTKLVQTFKNAFLIMLIHPLHNLGMVGGIVIACFILSYIPGLAFFFGGSFIAYMIMGTTYHAFKKTENRKKEKTEYIH